MVLEINYPYTIGKNGKTALVLDNDSHIKQMIEQVLFTTSGERVNRPTFGTGINQLIFSSMGEEISTAVQVLVQGALQQWIGDLITINSIQVNTQDSILQVQIKYTIKETQQSKIVKYSRNV